MKRLFLLLFLSPLSFAQEYKDLKFSLSCKVTGQVLIKTEDGVSTKFSSYIDGIKDGDTFNIEFELTYFTLINTFYDLLISIDSKDLFFSQILGSRRTEYSSQKNTIHYRGGNILTDSGSLRLNSMFANLALNRYYKNDFELMHSENLVIGEASRTLTANCMNMPSEYDEVISGIMAIEAGKKD